MHEWDGIEFDLYFNLCKIRITLVSHLQIAKVTMLKNLEGKSTLRLD